MNNTKVNFFKFFLIIKNYLKNFQFLVKTKRFIFSLFSDENGFHLVNINKTFPLFSPNSAGKYTDKASITIAAINQTIPYLLKIPGLTLSVSPVMDLKNNSLFSCDPHSSAELKVLFDYYGSDKANYHNYHFLYSWILSKRYEILNILEIGLGTNHQDVVSNMGRTGSPGASLRAFRDYCPNADIFGADIDRRILFQENRIKTFYIDQLNPCAIVDFLDHIDNSFDLIIDDGLHSPNANLATLNFSLNLLRVGGWFVIEDISFDALDLWSLVSAILPVGYKSHIFSADGGIIFAVQRTD